jgi:FkbM family methyltransferase
MNRRNGNVVMSLRAAVRKLRTKLLEQRERRRFFKQGVTAYQFGNYKIRVPENHATIKFMSRQPYRDLNIGVAAKFVCDKYRNGTIVDIGANIGDTASIIASQTKNKMILIEASAYYFDFLQQNSRLFPNETVLVNSFIGDGTSQSGELKHWGGTAYLEPSPRSDAQPIQTRRLQDVVDDDVAFIKIDTDGFDFKIINDSLAYLKRTLPALFFENSIRSDGDLQKADDTFSRLMEAGYVHFMVWDDPGFYITYTGSLDTLKDLNRYLFKIWAHEEAVKSIANFDVLCLKAEDTDVCHSIREYYRRY